MYTIKKRYSTHICLYEDAIKILYRQCARWAAASVQDNATIIKMLHANYAAGYLWAIKDIVTAERFYEITGEDFVKFENKIVDIQDASSKELIEKCPSLVFIKNGNGDGDGTIIKAMYSRNLI
jgi:hypothetical protein